MSFKEDDRVEYTGENSRRRTKGDRGDVSEDHPSGATMILVDWDDGTQHRAHKDNLKKI